MAVARSVPEINVNVSQESHLNRSTSRIDSNRFYNLDKCGSSSFSISKHLLIPHSKKKTNQKPLFLHKSWPKSLSLALGLFTISLTIIIFPSAATSRIFPETVSTCDPRAAMPRTNLYYLLSESTATASEHTNRLSCVCLFVCWCESIKCTHRIYVMAFCITRLRQ